MFSPPPPLASVNFNDHVILSLLRSPVCPRNLDHPGPPRSLTSCAQPCPPLSHAPDHSFYSPSKTDLGCWVMSMEAFVF